MLIHKLRGQLTVIKNALSFILEGRTGEISTTTREFIQEAYKRNEELIDLTMRMEKGRE